MVRITVNDETKKPLLTAGPAIELCDDFGATVVKVVVREKPIPAGWKPMTPELTEEELQRLSGYDGPGMTTEELLRRLREKQ